MFPKDNTPRPQPPQQPQPKAPKPKAKPPKLAGITLSKREFCDYVGVGMTTANRLISSGELPSLKIGKRRLLLIEDVHAWLNNLARRAS